MSAVPAFLALTLQMGKLRPQEGKGFPGVKYSVTEEELEPTFAGSHLKGPFICSFIHSYSLFIFYVLPLKISISILSIPEGQIGSPLRGQPLRAFPWVAAEAPLILPRATRGVF